MNLKREEIITLFFMELNKTIDYAVLHHIENIFNKEDDIDFIVSCNKEILTQFIINFITDNDLFLGNHYMIDIDIYRFDLFYFNENILEKIELDCACNSKGKDLLNINTKILLNNKTSVMLNNDIFFKVSNKDEFEYYIKKKAYKNSDISDYFTYLMHLNSDINEKDILNIYDRWIAYFNGKKHSIKFMFYKFHLLYNRLLGKQALTISFLGPDGSGKSTIIDIIKNKSLFVSYDYFHLKPIKVKQNTTSIENDPHKYSTYSPIKSYLKILYFIYQYNIGWMKNIFPLTIKSSLIIFDRYFDDLLVDQKRYRYGGSILFLKLARVFIPKPEIYFVLTTKPEIIYERKQEIKFSELISQVKNYKKLVDNTRYYDIDVNQTPEKISKDIITIMMTITTGRYK